MRKLRKTLVAALAAGCMTMLTMPAFAAALAGGWEAAEDTSISVRARTAFNRAADGYEGGDYEAVSLLATQVVSGTNYCFLCRSENGDAGYALVYVYADLEGNSEILGTKDIVIGDIDYDDGDAVYAPGDDTDFGAEDTTGFAWEDDDWEAPDEDGTLGADIADDDTFGAVPGTAASTEAKEQYALGETWVVDGEWELTIDSVEETSERNSYDDNDPAAVYIVTYTYKNLGYENEYMDGLYLRIDNRIVDAEGHMGYSYGTDISRYPKETPVGATCTAQVSIGVDHPGSFKIYVDKYGSGFEKYSAVFAVDVE